MTNPNKFAEALRSSEASAPDGEKPAVPARSRQGVKHVGGYYPPDVSRQLRQIALDEDTSVQALLGESLDMLFESRGKPAIAGSLKTGR